MQSLTISCWGKGIGGKTVVIHFISSLWGREKEEASEERLALWQHTVWINALGITQLCDWVNCDSSGVRTQSEREELNRWKSSAASSQLLFTASPKLKSCSESTEKGERGAERNRKLSSGSGERLYTSTQTNRWTRLESSSKWITPQVDSATRLQPAKHPTSYRTKAPKHSKMSGDITIPCLLCFIVFSSHLS